MTGALIAINYAIGIGELVLGLFFIKTNSGNEIRKVMAFLAFITGLWVLVITFNAYNINVNSAAQLDKWTYVFGAFIVTALFNLALIFPYRLLRLDWLHYVLLYVLPFFLSALALSSNEIIRSYSTGIGNSGTWYGGSLYWIYNLYMFVMYTGTVAIFFHRYPKMDGIHRKNLRLVIYSIVLGGIPAVLFDIVIPLFTNQGRFPLIGTTSTVVWLGVTAWIIRKK